MFFKPFKPKNRKASKNFRWKENQPNPAFSRGKRQIKQFFSQKRGEAATALTLAAVVLMTIGIFAGSRLAQKDADIRSRAQTSCPIVKNTNNPRLANGGICEVTINFTPGNPTPEAPRRLVCALIDPSQPAGSQVVAGVDPAKTAGYDFFSLTNVGKFPLVKQKSLSASKSYRLVAYQMDSSYTKVEPAGCVQERDYSGSEVVNLFDSSSTPQPTSTPAPSPTPSPTSQAQPSSCEQMAINKTGGSPAGVKTETDKTDSTGACNVACCEFNGQCPSGEQCSTKNGYCQSGFSCSPGTTQPTATPTPTKTPTPTPTPYARCETERIGYCYQNCQAQGNLKALPSDYGCSDKYGSGYRCCIPDELEITPPPTSTPTPTPTRTPTPTQPVLPQPTSVIFPSLSCASLDHVKNLTKKQVDNKQYLCFDYQNNGYCLEIKNINIIDDTFTFLDLTCKNHENKD